MPNSRQFYLDCQKCSAPTACHNFSWSLGKNILQSQNGNSLRLNIPKLKHTTLKDNFEHLGLNKHWIAPIRLAISTGKYFKRSDLRLVYTSAAAVSSMLGRWGVLPVPNPPKSTGILQTRVCSGLIPLYLLSSPGSADQVLGRSKNV